MSVSIQGGEETHIKTKKDFSWKYYLVYVDVCKSAIVDKDDYEDFIDFIYKKNNSMPATQTFISILKL